MKFWGRSSLRTRLMLVVCIAIIPLNILLLLLSRQLIINTENEILNSYKIELTMFCNNIDNDYRIIEQDFQTLFSDYALEFEYLNQSKELQLSAFSIWQGLKAIREKSTFTDSFYIYVRDTNDIYMTHHSKRVLNGEMQQIKTALLSDAENISVSGGTQTLTVGKERYLLKHLEYPNYSIGFLTKHTTLLKLLSELCSDQETLYIKDMQGTVLSQFSKAEVAGEHSVSAVFAGGTFVLERSIPGRLLTSFSKKLSVILMIIAGATFLVIPLLWLILRKIVTQQLQVEKYEHLSLIHI